MCVLVNTHEGHTSVEYAQEECAHDNARYGTDTTVSGGATDVTSADGVHLVAVTIGGLSGTHAGDGNQSDQTAEQTHVGVGKEVDVVGVDTRKLGCLLVATHGVEMTASGGLAGEEGIQGNHDSDPGEHDWNTTALRELVEEVEHNKANGNGLDDDSIEGGCLKTLFLADEVVAEGEHSKEHSDNHTHHDGQQIDAVTAKDVGEVGIGAATKDLDEGLILADGEGVATEHHVGQTTEGKHASQGDDKGWDAHIGNPEALHCADNEA